ncbi:hypothetical protein [Ammoniphilus resinae]|uniref:Uncharacterized protein n=1 Tax=Ammoniphilus resinae TaxID=861532 RepID=A0ABS4GKY4_9BACL|nr:hypothetical protein [Ammoniphilus resinae]MBP1930914.1 hypothetical protein [Ammoniphilus resinae]
MPRFYAFVGGLLGSLALAHASFTGTLSEVEPFFDVVALISLIVFSGALLWDGFKTLFNR